MTEDVDRLLIHQFGHQYSSDHPSEKFHEALCRLGARLKRLAMDKLDAIRGNMKEAEEGPVLRAEKVKA